MHTNIPSIDVFILVSNNSTGAFVASLFEDIPEVQVSYDIAKDVVEQIIPATSSIKWRLGRFLRCKTHFLSRLLGRQYFHKPKKTARLHLCVSRYALDTIYLHESSYPQARYLHIIDDLRLPSCVHLHDKSYVENLFNKKRLSYLEQSFSCLGLKKHAFLNLRELIEKPLVAFQRLEEVSSEKELFSNKESLAHKISERVKEHTGGEQRDSDPEESMRVPAFDTAWFLKPWSEDSVTFTNYEGLFFSNPYIRMLRKELHEKGIRVIFESCIPYQKDVVIKKLHIQWYNNLIRNFMVPLAPRFLSVPLQSCLRFIQYLFWRRRLQHYTSLALPIIWTVHDFHGLAYENSTLDLKLRKLVMDNATSIIVHNESIGDLISDRKPAAAIHYSPHPHYMDCYPDSISKEEARRRLGYTEQDVLILMQGIMRPYKGTVQAIQAFKEVSQQSCKLLIAGRVHPNFYEKQCIRVAEQDSRIKILNKDIPDAELQDYYRACDAVLFSFSQTTTSGSLLLAMGFQCPIIAPQHEILLRTLPDIQQPFLFDLDCIEEEVKAIERMVLCSSEQKEALGRANRASIQNHSWEKLAELLVSVYKEL